MKFLRYFLFIFLLAQFSQVSFAQMSDGKVVEYVKEQLSKGKSQTEIGVELLKKGVTKEQLERIKKDYNGKSTPMSVTQQSLKEGEIKRKVRASQDSEEEDQDQNLKQDEINFDEISLELDSTKTEEKVKSDIFGHDIFQTQKLTFEPNENGATPSNYKLGPDDELIITIWGDNETTIKETISPEGTIYISQIGPVQLSGITIEQATSKLTKLLTQKYSDLDDEGEGRSTSVTVSLGAIRTIRVNIMGEVMNPGTYRLSSFASVFTSLYRAGGVTELGSLRDIKVVRDEHEVAKVDIYDYLFNGKSETDIRLQEGDIIIVPPYVGLIKVRGSVKRPMKYEMLPSETLSTLFKFAGGFSGDAFNGDFCITRYNGIEKEIHTVKDVDASTFKMKDGDEVDVSASMDRYANMVEVKGCVARPGMFQLGGNIATVRQLITAAGGLLEDAFLDRALLLREKDNLDLETVSVDLYSVLKDGGSDVLLKKNDVLIVSSVHEIQDRGTLTIMGYVVAPGTYPFSDNSTIEDLILHSGGLLDGASVARVDVARRIVDIKGTTTCDTMAQVYSFPISEGLKIEGANSFTLKPYDVVVVRKSPSYTEQKFVYIDGEVAFPGPYAMVNTNERISSLIKRAGGLTENAYVKGAHLIRQSDANNQFLNSALYKLVDLSSNTRDSVDSLKINFGVFPVVLDLEKAMNHQGSDIDLVLQPGDSIYIPEYVNIVRIEGEVMFPTAVLYKDGARTRHYVEMAGGFSPHAKKSKTIVIFADGHAERMSRAKLLPGSIVLIPSKDKGKKMSAAEILALASTATSLASSVATMTYMIKR